MVKIVQIEERDIEAVSILAASLFLDDPFYYKLSDSSDKRYLLIKNIFKKSIDICIKHGLALGHKYNNTFFSFLLLFNYEELKNYHPQEFDFIIKGNEYTKKIDKRLLEEIALIEEIINGSKEYFYLLAVGVEDAYRRQGYASDLIDTIQNTYPNYNLFADISNFSSVDLYKKQGFNIVKEDPDLIFVTYESKQDEILSNNSIFKNLWLAIPSDFDISSLGLTVFDEFKCTLKHIQVIGDNPPLFISSFSEKSKVRVIKISYNDLVVYQRYINILFFEEITQCIKEVSILIYVSREQEFRGLQNYNCLHKPYNTKKEWDLIPDIYISIPILYIKKDKLLTNNKPSFFVNRILKSLDFRTTYESGIPVKTLDSRKFKYRIERFYLGSVQLQILEESTVVFNGNKQNEKPCGSPVFVDLIVSIDNQTNCGVLHIISISFGLLITQFLDSVSRNQINVLEYDRNVNLFSFLESKYGIEKKGSAKNFLTVHDNINIFDKDLLASILFCETLYDADDCLGKVADKEILEILSQKNGNAQYDYATVYTYKNILIQGSDSFRSSISDRLITESITLFYIELVLFEESAIEIANDQIIQFLAEVDKYPPKKVLKIINTIVSEHVKSIEFWNIQMNYPSSKKSIDDVVRKSFGLEELREIIKRNQKELLMIYDIRSDIVDKSEAILISVIGVVFTIISFVNLLSSTQNTNIIIGTFLVTVFAFFLYRKYLNKNVFYKKRSNQLKSKYKRK